MSDSFSWSMVLLPFIAATIGWFTNYIAVKMLFHPKEAIVVLGIKFHGIFPKRQKQIATSVGKMVANDLLNLNELKKLLSDEFSANKIIEKIEYNLSSYFEVKFPIKYPWLSKVVTINMRAKIIDEILGEVEQIAPSMINKQLNSLDHVLDIEALVTEKINKLSSGQLEKLLLNIIEKELRFIEWIGALLGFFIGIIQVLLLLI